MIRTFIAIQLILCIALPVLAGNVTVDNLGRIYSGPANFDVMLSDQVSPAGLIYFNQLDVTDALAAKTAIGDMSIEVDDDAGMVDGGYVGIFDTISDRFYQGHIVGSPVTNTVSLDTPMSSVLPIGSTVGVGHEDMAVNGASATQVFTLRGADPGIDVTIDVTKIIIMMETTTALELNEFGDLAALTYGLVLRGVNGITYNFGNIKSNADMITWAAMVQIYDASNPGQGIYGLSAVFSFAGQNAAGVAIRVGPGETLEIWVQDNISGLESMRIAALFHVVVD